MKNKKMLNKTVNIALLAMLLAVRVLLERYAALNVWNMKINAAFIPLMLAAYLLGPVGSVLVAGLGDVIGAVLFPTGAYFPGFTATAALTGLVFGFCFYKKYTFPRAALGIVSTQIVFSYVVNTVFISVLYGSPMKALFVTRIPQVVIMTAVMLVFTALFFRNTAWLDRLTKRN